MLDRATIMIEAHVEARRARQATHYQRPGFVWSTDLRAWLPVVPYRVTFARCLRETWHAHRHVAAELAYEASLPPVDADTLATVAAMRADARLEPFTAAGDARMVAQLAAASALLEAARYGAGAASLFHQ